MINSNDTKERNDVKRNGGAEQKLQINQGIFSSVLRIDRW